MLPSIRKIFSLFSPKVYQIFNIYQLQPRLLSQVFLHQLQILPFKKQQTILINFIYASNLLSIVLSQYLTQLAN